jgi:hypothetical protein
VLKLLTQWLLNDFKYDATGNPRQMTESILGASIPTRGAFESPCGENSGDSPALLDRGFRRML